MTNEPKQVLPEDPSEAEFGRGAPGDNHIGVQTAQTTAVNAPDAIIPSNAPTELSEKQLAAFRDQEAHETSSDNIDTTGGYVEDEGGALNNFAVEPPMYYAD